MRTKGCTDPTCLCDGEGATRASAPHAAVPAIGTTYQGHAGAPRQLTRVESIEVDKAAGVHPNLRFCRDESCKIPHEHEAHDKVYDVNDHLERVKSVIGERGTTRDLSKGERSMARCVRAFNAITGRDLSAREGWLFMACLKLARMQTGKYKQDDYDDHTGYSALMAEEARREHEKQTKG